MIFNEEYISWSSSLHTFIQPSVNSSSYLLSTPHLRALHVQSVVDKVVLGQANFRTILFPPVIIPPPMLLPHHLSTIDAIYQWRTDLLTPWCTVLEKLTGLQLIKKFPAFHGTRRFITTLTSVRHLSLSWTSRIQSIYPHPTSWRSILIVSTHLRLGPHWSPSLRFPQQDLIHPLSSLIRATRPAHLILVTNSVFK